MLCNINRPMPYPVSKCTSRIYRLRISKLKTTKNVTGIQSRPNMFYFSSQQKL